MQVRTSGRRPGQGRHLHPEPASRPARLTVRSLVVAVVAALALPLLSALPASAADTIVFRAAAQTFWNQPTARVTIPAAVRETDGMLLFVTKNNASATITSPPAGWTLEGSRLSSTDTETFLYSRVAAANDAGRNAAITFSATTKSTVTLLAYDGTAADPVAVFASAAETVSRATHTTPVAQVATAGSYVVSYWADKSASTTTGFTVPAGQVQRSLALGTGAGRINAVASDSGTPSGVGPTTPRTATGAVATAKATMWTVVLQADQESDTNVAPVASFTAGCSQLVCTVDASASTDTAPGTIASYAWDFGDSTTGTGVSTAHTYANPGTYTVTLRVTDNQGAVSAPVTRTVTATAANPRVEVPGHNRLVPDKPRANTPRISNGEIWDIEVVEQLNRVFIAGNFSGIQNTTGANTAVVNQAGLASYNLTTGLIDTSFRPTFNGGVSAVEASPDGTKLFVGGSFSTVNGVAKQKVASLNLTTGAPLSTFGFTNSTNNAVTALAATNSTVYVGGRFTRLNGVLMTGLGAVNAASGVVDTGFQNQLAGGIGVDGQLGVPQLKLTHDETKLLVVHTGRQIAGQDRLGMGIVDTRTKQLLPWRSQLWDENLARVGGVTRIYAADIAPDDSYFVVASGSGGDAPPISDTVIAYSLSPAALQSSDNDELWISRHFDSIYSVAITEVAVYVGGHFSFIESPESDDPWPGLDNVGYGTGQGLAGYGLGEQVVRRDHIAALKPSDGRSMEWNPTDGSNSFEGNKAMEATPRGLFIGGDGQFQGGVRTGRVAFYDFNTVTNPPAAPDTTISTPIEGRVVASGAPFDVTGTARVATGTVGRVQVTIQDRDAGTYLTAANTWTRTATSVDATLAAGTGTTRSWTLPGKVADLNRRLLVTAKAFTTGGAGDTTTATKRFESFSTTDQTPTTSISGPSGVQTSGSFTVTGTAVDDKGVNSLSFWFRDEQNRYLQADGSVDDIFHTFRGEPDVIGATNATWSYDVVLPHEGVWRGSATAVDTIGQADLRSATRDWTVDSNAVAPTVTIADPVAMTPPFSVPAVTVEPGGRLTFTGTAADDQGLKNVEISLRNSSTGEALGADGTWGLGVSAGQHRISPVDISGTSYNWAYTTPFNLSAGTYSFTVRATDDSDLTTSSTNQGRLTINAQIAGDLAPDTGITFVAPTDKSLTVNLAGSATDDLGVANVRVALQDRSTGRYLQANGSMAAAIAYREATLNPAGATSTSWSLPAITLPSGGQWRFTAVAFDTRGQQDPSAATASYTVWPGDGLPGLSDTLGQPVSGASFTDGKIVVTGRAEDAADAFAGIANVQIAVVNAAGQYMSSTGTFTSTTASYRSAFLNSPGSVGSNYSYTTPVIPSGTYSVIVRSVDVHDQVMDPPRTSTGVTVTAPSNNPPVASFTYSCNQNVCTFDGRSSTDETPTSLTYSWSFGTQGTATGPLPTKTFTAAGSFPVTLTVRDEWTLTNTSAAQVVTIVEPSGNSAPVPTFAQSCTGLTCAVSSAGTADPNTGDTISYLWAWGDGTTSTGAAPAAKTYAAAGSYTITLTTTDGWGKAASTTRAVTLSEPANNTAPTVTFTASCTSFTTCQMNSAGTVDPQGDTIRYSWNFGDGSAAVTTASPARTYATPGTYTIVLTATDVWGKAATAERTVTITEPASNNAPVAVIGSATCSTFTTCVLSPTGSADPDAAGGDAIRSYVWNFGDGSPEVTSTSSASQTKVYAVAGTYTVTLRVVDRWGRTSATVSQTVSTQVEPAGNQAPTATFTATCTVRTCAVNSTGTADTDGGIRSYLWTWGDNGATSTGAAPASRTYTAAGTYTITLVVTDNWGRSTTVTRQVTVA